MNDNVRLEGIEYTCHTFEVTNVLNFVSYAIANISLIKSEGVVGASKDNPQISAPRDFSQRVSQLPLKPVWPVIITFLTPRNLSIRVYVSSITISSKVPCRLSQRLCSFLFITQGVHRVPKPCVLKCHELTLLS